MFFDDYICALDIGSSKVASSVARLKNRSISGLFLESQPAKGIKRGVIVDSAALSECIARVIKNLRSKSNINIKVIYINISGQDIITKHSSAVIPLAERASRTISTSDIEKVNEQARILGANLELEIIHAIPHSYTIDDKSNIINPLGLYSHRLETDLYLICARSQAVDNLTSVVNQAGYEIRGIFLSGIVTAQAIFNKRERSYTKAFNESANLICDIGSDIIELSLFEEGRLKITKILAIGGSDLTSELSKELKIPIDFAEDVKRSYGIVGDPQEIDEEKEILVKKDELYNPIKQRLVCEILSAGAKIVCVNIKKTVEKIIPLTQIDNFIVSGRTQQLEGFLELLESVLCIPIKIARINNPLLTPHIKYKDFPKENYLTYLTSLGILAYVLEDKRLSAFGSQGFGKNIFSNVVERIRHTYEDYF